MMCAYPPYGPVLILGLNYSSIPPRWFIENEFLIISHLLNLDPIITQHVPYRTLLLRNTRFTENKQNKALFKTFLHAQRVFFDEY